MTTFCVLHRVHRPKALTVELHHVIPQAWQQVFTTPHVDDGASLAQDHSLTDWVPGHGDQGRMLWDARTVALCPTGHRNVHHHLVLAMRGVTPRRVRGKEHALALLAMERFTAAGGDLAVLRAHGLFGQA